MIQEKLTVIVLFVTTDINLGSLIAELFISRLAQARKDKQVVRRIDNQLERTDSEVKKTVLLLSQLPSARLSCQDRGTTSDTDVSIPAATPCVLY